jgi:long-chain-fatty-acid--CoA ligase ACSBG
MDGIAEFLTTPPGVYVAGAVACGAVGYQVASGAPPPEKIASKAPRSDGNPYSPYTEGPFSTTKIDDVLPIQFAESGVASEAVTPAETIPAVFQRAVAQHGDKVALRVERPLKPLAKGETPPPALPDDEWKTWTYKEYYADCSKLGRALLKLGATAKEAVAIYGFNAPEWHIAAVGAILANVKPAGLYPTDTADLVQYKAEHSGSIVIFVGDAAKLDVVLSIADQLPKLKAVVCWDEDVDTNAASKKTSKDVMSFATFLDLGAKTSERTLDAVIDKIEPGGCAGFIYTSGTTGKPTAVMMSHDNYLFECNSIKFAFPNVYDGATELRSLSYLPLSHVLGMAFDIFVPIFATGMTGTNKGCFFAVSFARPYDLKSGSLGDRLRSVKPSLFIGVPRVYEKIAEKMKAVGAQTKGVKKMLSTFAKGKALEHAKNCQIGGSGAYPPFYTIANKIVLSKIKAALGFQECRLLGGGGAPFQPATLEYWGSLGFKVMEGYGMSETTGGTSINTHSCHQWGTIGSEIPGTEMKILKVDEANPDAVTEECPAAADLFHPTEAEQGEVCFRGRLMMMGYLGNPDLGTEHVKTIEKKTAEAIDAEGWLHSGDKGCLSDAGMLRISGRYKELIIGAGGENIAPVPIEDAIKVAHPGIANIVMVGNQRKYNVALITLKAVGATGQLPGGDDLDGDALTINPSVTKVSQAMDDAVWIKSITDAITAVNKDGSVCPNNNFKIQKFSIMPMDLSIDNGELGPTLKTKRFFIEDKFKIAIDALYSSKDTYVRFK